MKAMENPEDRRKALLQEEETIRRIQAIVDRACVALSLGILTPKGAKELINETRRRVLQILPDKEETFDLIYLPRLIRFAHQFGGIDLKKFI
ncbi:MAG: hypothetical protein ACK4OO_04825 [bacterium]